MKALWPPGRHQQAQICLGITKCCGVHGSFLGDQALCDVEFQDRVDAVGGNQIFALHIKGNKTVGLAGGTDQRQVVTIG